MKIKAGLLALSMTVASTAAFAEELSVVGSGYPRCKDLRPWLRTAM